MTIPWSDIFVIGAQSGISFFNMFMWHKIGYSKGKTDSLKIQIEYETKYAEIVKIVQEIYKLVESCEKRLEYLEREKRLMEELKK